MANMVHPIIQLHIPVETMKKLYALAEQRHCKVDKIVDQAVCQFVAQSVLDNFTQHPRPAEEEPEVG